MKSPIDERWYDHRLRALCEEAVTVMGLDLSGMRVVTEAASGIYLLTPLIALLGGAEEVVCLGRTTSYGRIEDISWSLLSMSSNWGLPAPYVTVNRRDSRLQGADLVTNAGMCRPLDAELLSWIGNQTVVPYMYEAWELRPGDVDFEYCSVSGIPVFATDEHQERVGVFKSVGTLAVKMLLDSGLEVTDNRIAVMSSDPFGPAICEALEGCGSHTRLYKLHDNYDGLEQTAWDAIVVAEYHCGTTVLGNPDLLSASRLKKLASGCPLVIQYAGHNDIRTLTELGLPVYPNVDLPPYRMAKTLAHLGPRPAIFLHAAGLAVGEKMVRAKRAGLTGEQFAQYVKTASPAQGMNYPTSV